jgi:hypothetical protein
MSANPRDPLAYFVPRDGERLRNSWSCWEDEVGGRPIPVVLLLTNLRVVAIRAMEFEGFWDPKPSRWMVTIDRDLPELPL